MSDDDVRCPVCRKGVVADIGFDADATSEGGKPFQDPSGRQWTRFSCGHEVEGPRLASADADAMDVERRASEDTVDPPGA
jgi:hypothetical protein